MAELIAVILLPLAVWRLSYMLTVERGPGDIFETTRYLLRGLKVLDCLYCTSVWVALAGLVALTHPVGQLAILWLALSSVVIILHTVLLRIGVNDP